MQAIQRANSLYDTGLRLLAEGDYDSASDQFQSCVLATQELLLREDVSEVDAAALRSLAGKAQHLSTRALQRTVLRLYAGGSDEPVPPDNSSYSGYDSLAVTPVLPPVEPEMNQKVQKWVDFYSRSGGKLFTNWLTRSGQYMGMVKDILRQEGVPEELAYLVLIESGFNLQARSWAHAVGPWQFILGTARLFGLRIDPWIDERCDPEKSTVAAARYLKYLYSIFDSWPLAIAAYNGGEGTVLRALERQKTDDFWSLKLPRQTEEYVPQFMAALELAREPAKYGLIEEVPQALPFEEVVVRGPVDLRTIARACETPMDTVKLLNPSFRRTKTPSRSGGHRVRVPVGRAQGYVSTLAEDGIEAESRARGLYGEGMSPGPVKGRTRLAGATGTASAAGGWHREDQAEDELYVTYKVRKGDSLYRIAKNFGTTVREIEEYNDIGSRKIIKPGQRILIPRDAVKLAASPSKREVSRSARLEHTVRRGDTLYAIARAYGVSVKDIVRWNKLESAQLIRAGQKLVILPDDDRGTEAETASD